MSSTPPPFETTAEGYEVREVVRKCDGCGEDFIALQGRVLGRTIAAQRYCDACIEAREADVAAWERRRFTDRSERQQTPPELEDYPDFDPDHPDLPAYAQTYFAALNAWTEGPRGIGAKGPPFIGKTRALYAFARRWAERGKRWAVVPDMQLNDIVRDTRDNGARQRELLQRIHRADFILWDDFGAAKMTDPVEKFYLNALSHCQAKDKPMFVTLNHGGRYILQRWQENTGEARFLEEDGRRILNRVFERCEIMNLHQTNHENQKTN